ncbi:unnamed protein product [Medioppia subpectinata]|uniref:non-specific serine/threonine protein kinase n=1 Tax=Medioppia subpectinata TaxID=1979941 RepID=A0A7R9PYB2_9ACAR|nr:unnamed protein product [Medioppia subpectinata]CAG2105710.1 unnamed protein product [Medioppia subpectinata]
MFYTLLKIKQRILREMKILLKLYSNFVVKYITSWPESNHLYIQIELCSQSLKSVLKDKAIVFGRQPENPINVYEYFICCEIFTEILECVQFLHSSDPPVIYRDLKPENILIEHNFMSNRFIKVCDFGLATDHDMPSMSHTAGAGTSAYMAPDVHHHTLCAPGDGQKRRQNQLMHNEANIIQTRLNSIKLWLEVAQVMTILAELLQTMNAEEQKLRTQVTSICKKECVASRRVDKYSAQNSGRG